MHYKWWSLNTRALQLTATTNSRRHIADAAAVNWKNNSVTTPCPSAERRGKAGHTVEAIWLHFICKCLIIVVLYNTIYLLQMQ